jgi:hypothetical protein
VANCKIGLLWKILGGKSFKTICKFIKKENAHLLGTGNLVCFQVLSFCHMAFLMNYKFGALRSPYSSCSPLILVVFIQISVGCTKHCYVMWSTRNKETPSWLANCLYPVADGVCTESNNKGTMGINTLISVNNYQPIIVMSVILYHVDNLRLLYCSLT